MPEDTLVQAVKTAPSDAGENFSQVVLPVPSNRVLLLFRRPDGSLVLRSTEAISDEQAQHAYDTNPELRDILNSAAQSPTVYRERHRRR